MSKNNHFIKGTSASEKYKEFLEARGSKGKGLLNHSAIRHDRFIRESIPILSENIDLSNRNVIEFGFGHGSATHAISHFANHVYAFDINENLLENSAKRTELFNLQNITFTISSPDNIIDDALKVADSNTVFILHAVLEHMTEEERYTTLTKIWSFMGDDNYLYIGNTPNKLSWLDIHTHDGVPFLFSLPDYTCAKYLALHPEIRFAKQFTNIHNKEGLEAFSLNRKRRGMGISYHDFEIAFQGYDLNECIILSGAHQPLQLNDALLGTFFLKYNVDIPLCFIKRDMTFLVRKSMQQSDRDQVRNQNKKFRQKLRPVIIDALSDFIEQEKGGRNKTKKKKNNLFLRIKNLIKRVLQRLSN